VWGWTEKKHGFGFGITGYDILFRVFPEETSIHITGEGGDDIGEKLATGEDIYPEVGTICGDSVGK
jgi:hypothetical protein